jgi:hypothetical protein
MLLTLNNIELDEYMDEVVIRFTYEGDNVEFKGTMRLSPEEFLASREQGDEYLVNCILQRELHWWINQ